MPFKSEAQRKYLWANEPEIARDWTDTYGSGIHKAKGGRIGFRRGTSGAPGGGDPGMTSDPSGRGQTFADQRDPNRGARPGQSTTPTHIPTQPIPKISTDEKINQALNRYIPGRKSTNIADRMKHIRTLNPSQIKQLIAAGILEYDDEQPYGTQRLQDIRPTDLLASSRGLGQLQDDFKYQGGYHDVNNPNSPNYEPPTGGGQGEQPWLYPPGGIADTGTGSSTVAGLGLGQGHFQVPLEYVYNQTRAADGGIIGSVGGTSRQKYQEGNMVGAVRGGVPVHGEMESAMMQSKEVIKDLYDALTAQGLSPQEAMEEIKRMLSGIRPEPEAEEWPRSPDQGPPQTPMPELGGGPRAMPEFPRRQSPAWPGGRELLSEDIRGGRAPAAFGGIMDTYTGRRKYGFGSFNPFKAVKKGLKKLKKLASSKLGKMALMYAAGTYLGGTQALGGAGWGSTATPWKTFGKQLLDPKFTGLTRGTSGIGNVFTPSNWGMFQQAAPQAAASWPGGRERFLGQVPQKSLPSKIGKYLLDNPMATILGGSLLAGATAEETEEVGDVEEEYDEKKAAMDAYLAPMAGAYRVPKEYVVPRAEGGRIGRQEGGLMDLGGMEKDYREDGGFVPLGGEEKADDVPARLSRNEFVFTADAVKNAGGGDIDKGAEVMENVMKNLEAGGKVSEESQGQGAEEMFEVSERLSEVV